MNFRVAVGVFASPVILGALLAVGLRPVASPAEDKAVGGPLRFIEFLIQDNYGYAFGIGAADIDGDGHLDVISTDTTKNFLYWFAGDGKGKFTPFVAGRNEEGWLERFAIADINKDGRLDLVIVKNLHVELVWYKNSGTPRDSKPWKRHQITTKFPRSYDVAVADFDGDGQPDVAASAWTGNMFAIFKNSGTPEDGKEWARHMIDTKIGETRTIRVADFNGDGKPDLLGTARVGNMVVWYENPGKAFAQNWKRNVIDDKSVGPTHGQPIDLDADGDVDVLMALGAFSAAGGIVWYENVGKPGKGTKWKKHVIGALPGAFEAFAADLNGDGLPDVVATAYGTGGKLVWFENPGDPKKTPWKMQVLKENWARANQVIVADLNKDGRPDIIAAAERGANEVRWWRNDGKK